MAVLKQEWQNEPIDGSKGGWTVGLSIYLSGLLCTLSLRDGSCSCSCSCSAVVLVAVVVVVHAVAVVVVVVGYRQESTPAPDGMPMGSRLDP